MRPGQWPETTVLPSSTTRNTIICNAGLIRTGNVFSPQLPPYPVPMRHYSVTEGTRAEILAELDQYGRDRTAQGKPEKAAELAEAWREVRDGATWVEVGKHQVYRVVEDEA